MTYFNNSNHIIETDDIHDVQGVHVTQEDGKTVAWLKTILNPDKDFQTAKQFWVHLTNGVEHRTIGPIPSLNPLVPPSALSGTDDETSSPATDVSTNTDTSVDASTLASPEQATEDNTPTRPIPATNARRSK